MIAVASDSSSSISSSGATSDTDTDLVKEAVVDSSPFSVGEKVLAFHHNGLYEAKVQKVQLQTGTFQYHIHYVGWKKSWDEWVGLDRLLKLTQENLWNQEEINKKHNEEEIAKPGRGPLTRPMNSTVARGRKRKNDSIVKINKRLSVMAEKSAFLEVPSSSDHEENLPQIAQNITSKEVPLSRVEEKTTCEVQTVASAGASTQVQAIFPDEAPSKSNDDFDALFQDLASLETSLRKGTSDSGSSQLSFPVDPDHVEILKRFYTLLDIPVGDLTEDQLTEFTVVVHKLKAFAPLVLSWDQVESAQVYARGLSNVVTELQDLNLQISKDQALIQHHYSTKMKAKAIHDNCVSCRLDLVVAVDKEKELLKQLMLVHERQRILKQQISEEVKSVKSLLQAFSSGLSTTTINQRVKSNQSRMDVYVNRWQTLRAMFQDNPRG